MRNSFILIIIVAFGVMLYGLFDTFSGNDQLSDLSAYYAQKENVEKVQSANLVTAVVVTYRGLDTLGEVTILFLTAAIIGFFLHNKNEKRVLRENSEIFITAARLLIPIIILVGVYIFINGHLTPGGGFQGGAVIASAVILMIMAFPEREFNSKFFTYLESTSGSVFVALAALGAVIGGGFLDNKIVPMGTFGELVSAGAIPIIYSFVGLKVGAELSSILGNYQSFQSE